MDWQALERIVTILTPIGLGILGLLTLWMNARIAAAKAAAERAVAVAETTATVAEAKAEETGKKITDVQEQLDGRITQFMAELDKRVADAFARGRAGSVVGSMVESQARVEEHLREQDRVAAERHAASTGPTKTSGEPHARRADDIATDKPKGDT